MEMPDLSRTDAGTLLVSEWIVQTSERQHAAAEALFGEWRDLSATFRPEAFLELDCFASADGRVLLSVALWTSDEAHLAFVRAHRAAMVSRIDQDVPGIERPGLVRFRLARTIRPEALRAPSSEVVLVRAEAETAAQVEHWRDATAEQLLATSGALTGQAHLLVSTDGRTALQYAPVPPDASDATPPTVEVTGVSARPPQRYRLLGGVRGPRG